MNSGFVASFALRKARSSPEIPPTLLDFAVFISSAHLWKAVNGLHFSVDGVPAQEEGSPLQIAAKSPLLLNDAFPPWENYPQIAIEIARLPS